MERIQQDVEIARRRNMQWLNRHARKIPCPQCTGKRPSRLEDSVVKCPCICPKCHRVWLYEINYTKAVRERIVHWRFSSIQPFLDEQCQQDQNGSSVR